MSPQVHLKPNAKRQWPLILALAILSACRPDVTLQTQVVADLVMELAAAEVISEPGTIDFGTAEARPFLDVGWSRDEVDAGTGRAFVWATGPRAEIVFPWLEPRSLDLALDCRPFTFSEAPPQTVTVALNGTKLGQIVVSQEPLRLAVPASAWVAGSNRLSFDFSYHRRPRDVLVGAMDQRSLAMSCNRLRFGAQATAEVQADYETKQLWLPAGSQVDFFLRLPEQARLQANLQGVRGDAVLSLETMTESGQTARHRFGRGEGRWPKGGLPLPGPGLVRLRLSAASGATDSNGTEPAGVALVRPTVVTPVAPGAPFPQNTAPEATAPEATAQATGARPDVILYAIDTLRADRVGVYGPLKRGATPHLDAFAAGAWVFERAMAQSSWTRAAMGSVLTGLWPPEHGAVGRRHRLSEQPPTLAEVLAAVGYETAAFVTNPNLTSAFGFERGFETFRYLGEETTAAQVNAQVAAFLRARQDDRPLFLWLHTLDPHSPYDSPTDPLSLKTGVPADLLRGSLDALNDLRAGRRPMNDEVLAHLEALYLAEIFYADAQFGAFRQLLEDLQRFDESLFIVLSDHGEEFYEHGNLEHGRALFAESIHVPLIIKPPGKSPAGKNPGRRLHRLAEHRDVLPTVLAQLGLENDFVSGLDGENLLAPAVVDRKSRIVISHLHLDGAERLAVIEGSFKLLYEPATALAQLFDLHSDPAELRDLAAANPVRRGFLVSQARHWLQKVESNRGREVELDTQTRRSLKALGYL